VLLIDVLKGLGGASQEDQQPALVLGVLFVTQTINLRSLPGHSEPHFVTNRKLTVGLQGPPIRLGQLIQIQSQHRIRISVSVLVSLLRTPQTEQ